VDPFRLILWISVACADPARTIPQIKATLALIKTSALSNPDSPNRGHDVAYYCDLATASIVDMEAAGLTALQIKETLPGRLTHMKLYRS
jgi:hypothetical protein